MTPTRPPWRRPDKEGRDKSRYPRGRPISGLSCIRLRARDDPDRGWGVDGVVDLSLDFLEKVN